MSQFRRSLARRTSAVIVVLSLCTPRSFALAAQEAASSEAPASILNPYHTQPIWRLWTEDQTPVTYNGSKDWRKPKQRQHDETFAPPKAADRLFPVFSGPTTSSVFPTLRHSESQPPIAGFWDDCYVTLDYAHTRIQPGWSTPAASIKPIGQFINVHFGMADTATRMSLGANFTSQSFARRGRHIVDDTATNVQTERDFFFVNCIRATPAHISYKDENPKQAYDAYDGLFAHSYHSIGQSGSEIRALTKMLIAGGCMPRATKDLLKRHGAYASALLTIFKAALPYVDAGGADLPYEHELRHRPAYSSDGSVGHIHYCPANSHYHGYDETRHMRLMIELARRMDVAPPIAILKLLDVTVEKDGKTIVDRVRDDSHVQSVCKTSIRVWGKPGETLIARIDVRDSYDLQGRELTYSWHSVYPNQKNVQIEEDEPGVWLIRVQHDPKLPKGRIPVMLVARNDSPVPSNPAFVNFYWPEPNEQSDWPHMGEGRNHRGTHEVTQNKRPVLEPGIDGDSVWVTPGQTAKFSLNASDPEGFPIHVYRRRGEIGSIENGQFQFVAAADDPGSVRPAHLIFSDGTAGYTGWRVKAVVSPDLPVLPDDWHITPLGLPHRPGTARLQNDVFQLTGAMVDSNVQPQPGMFTYTRLSNDIDLICRVDRFDAGACAPAETSLALMVRTDLHEKAPHAAVAISPAGPKGKVKAARFLCRPNWSLWSLTTDTSEISAAGPISLRLVRRNPWCAGFVSSDGKRWRQIGCAKLAQSDQLFAGLALVNGPFGPSNAAQPAHATCKWITPDRPSIPLVAVDGKRPNRDARYAAPVTITLSAGDETAPIACTLDGQDPTKNSPKYGGPIVIDQPGTHELRTRLVNDREDTPIVTCTVRVAADGKGGT